MTNYTSTALITGGTSGIGRATANKLAQLSIRVVVVGLNAERGKKTVDEIRSIGGKADFISGAALLDFLISMKFRGSSLVRGLLRLSFFLDDFQSAASTGLG